MADIVLLWTTSKIFYIKKVGDNVLIDSEKHIKKSLANIAKLFDLAGVLRLELSPAVLETDMLPLTPYP